MKKSRATPIDTITAAAEILEEHAAALKLSHGVAGGGWDDPKERDRHQRAVRAAKGLRQIVQVVRAITMFVRNDVEQA